MSPQLLQSERYAYAHAVRLRSPRQYGGPKSDQSSANVTDFAGSITALLYCIELAGETPAFPGALTTRYRRCKLELVADSDQEQVAPAAWMGALAVAHSPWFRSWIVSTWYETPAWLFQESTTWFVARVIWTAIGTLGTGTVTA